MENPKAETQNPKAEEQGAALLAVRCMRALMWQQAHKMDVGPENDGTDTWCCTDRNGDFLSSGCPGPLHAIEDAMEA